MKKFISYFAPITLLLVVALTPLSTIQAQDLSCSIVQDNPVSVFGGNDGQATVTATGGVAPYSYLWDGATANNTSLDFDGVDTGAGSYVDIGAFSLTSYTKEAWIKWDGTEFLQHNIISGSINGSQHAFWIVGDELRSGHSGSFLQVNDPEKILPNIWYHCAVTYDGTSGLMSLYKNGDLVSSAIIATGFVLEGTYIGAFGNPSNQLVAVLAGQIDDVRVWDYARTQSEIQADMNSCLNGTEPGLEALYDFEDGTGSTTLSDITGNGNNGILMNMDPATDWVMGKLCGNTNTGPTATGLTAGDYTVTITDATGSMTTCSVTIDEPDELSCTGIELIDADNDVSLGSLTDGMVIDVSTLPTLNLSIEGFATDGVESLEFVLSGAMSHTKTESVAPYTLYGDTGGGSNYNGSVFALGSYTIVVTPYSENGLGGTQGTPLVVNFELVDAPVDNDGDGFVAGVDCDDNDPNVFPGAIEVCDGIDNNCDGQIDEGLTTTYYADTDGDGYGDPFGDIELCGPQAGYVTDNTDCNDTDAGVNPGAIEICDGIDNNCDGNVDEGFITDTYYADTDNDGFGDPNNSLQSCGQPAGFVTNNMDCDDTNISINPNATEVCDGVDNNCNGLVDGDEPGVTCSTVLSITGIELIDADNDVSLGPLTDGMVIDISSLATLNLSIEGFATDDVESMKFVLSGAMSHTQTESVAPYTLYGDTSGGSNYNGSVFALGSYTIVVTPYSENGLGGTQGTPLVVNFELVDAPVDNDGDGFVAGVDCDDNDPNVFPGAIEVCDGIDNNCDGQIDEGLTTTYYADTDGDGYGDPFGDIELCGPQAGYVTDNTDCNDTDAGVNPGAIEICDGIDNNCDGNVDEGFSTDTYYADTDNDGFGDPNNSLQSCGQPAGFVTNNMDCDDTNISINPNATEVCDGVDNNCNGLVDGDEPGVTCSTVLSITGIELIDADNDVSLGPLTDGMVIDVSTLPTLNLSLEGFATDDVESLEFVLSGAMSHTQTESVAPYTLYGDTGGGSNYNGSVFALGSYTIVATPYSDNGLGGTQGTPRIVNFTLVDAPVDNDGDGFVAGVDCDDNDPNVFPGAIEVCDGIDNNCDGQIDEGLTTTYYADTDGDGYGDPFGEIQLCGPQAGYVADNTDCNDTDAGVNPGAIEICDGIDNNCDGNVDEGFSTDTYYADLDGDGFGDPNNSVQGCMMPIGYVLDNTDCNDNDTSVNPSALEICDGIDNNCDGLVDGDEPGVTCSTVLSVTGIELIDASNDVSLGPLTDGMVIDVSTLPTLNLSIEAFATDDVESMKFVLSGAMSHTQTESVLPYALYGDTAGGSNYNGSIFALGSYTITVTPYAENGLGGTQGTPLVVNFELVDGGPLRNASDPDASIHDLVKVNVWPNPSETTFNLELDSETELGNVKMSVFDSSHKLIHTGEFNSKGMYAFGANFVSGVYTVKLVHAKGVETVRIIKE